MSRPSIAKRTAWFVLAGFAMCACGSTHDSATSPASAVPSPVPDTSPIPDTSPRGLLTPSATSLPNTVQGPLTKPVPGDVTAVTVSFLRAGDRKTVAYRTTVTSPESVRTLVDAVDSLHITGSYSKGCSMSPVDLRLDFAAPGHASSFVEDSSCRYATLTIDGVVGPQLDSAELYLAEQVVGKTAVFGPDGQPAISAAPSSSAS